MFFARCGRWHFTSPSLWQRPSNSIAKNHPEMKMISLPTNWLSLRFHMWLFAGCNLHILHQLSLNCQMDWPCTLYTLVSFCRQPLKRSILKNALKSSNQKCAGTANACTHSLHSQVRVRAYLLSFAWSAQFTWPELKALAQHVTAWNIIRDAASMLSRVSAFVSREPADDQLCTDQRAASHRFACEAFAIMESLS